MLHDSLFTRYRVFVLAATIGAHANSPDGVFRQRDLRFLIELFSNWMETWLGSFALPVKNPQVMRFLDSLVQEGFARRLTRGAHPAYRLTRTGLIELTSQMVEGGIQAGRWQFLFLFYFIKNYRDRIIDLVKREGSQFPPALQAELESSLDLKRAITRELESVQRELERLQLRIDDARKVSEMLRSRRKSEPFSKLVEEIERLYPYELNNQRPLTELMGALPEEIGQWELETGAALRAKELWMPTKRLLESYRQELYALRESTLK